MTIQDFVYFVKEGKSVHVKHDSSLYDFTQGMTDWEKLFYIFIYKTFHSDSKILKQLTGVWMHDYRNLMLLDNVITPGITDSRYIRAKNLLIKKTLPSMKRFWLYFNELKDAEIFSVETELSNHFLHFSKRPMKDLAYSIIKDASYYFSEKFDQSSRCHFSNNATKVLRRISKKGSLNVERLLDLTGLNHSSLNRALEDYSEYIERKEMYAKWESLVT